MDGVHGALTNTPRKPQHHFHVGTEVDNETLLAKACETLTAARVMFSDFAGLLEGSHRNTMLGIQQVVMLGELAGYCAYSDNLICRVCDCCAAGRGQAPRHKGS
ncbi:DUF6124 family protein [Pseudomonas mandelii]|uniref:DUF6124 family protein n=1 Tax=Pseudomonas mandelii TaxID=75612 RepID=UPI0020A193B4|nr:DUF6124 family protein [Pseudomonas mandelii]